MSVLLKYKKLSANAIPFEYTRSKDACMDIFSPIDITLNPGLVRVVLTDIAVQIPEGYEGRIIGRSGLASKGVFVNHGVIDETFTGNLGVVMIYQSNAVYPYEIKTGDRIAQFSIHQKHHICIKEVSELPNTERNEQGFGSSGV